MSSANEISPIEAVKSALRDARIRYSQIAPEEKQLLLSSASQHLLSQIRSDPSLHVPEELDLQRAPDSASFLSRIGKTKSDLISDAILVRDFYYDAKTISQETRFQIPLEFLIMLDEAARLAPSRPCE